MTTTAPAPVAAPAHPATTAPRLVPLLLLTPAALFVGVFLLLPLLLVVVLAACRVDLVADTVAWIGAGNVVDELSDPEFTRALSNTVLYALATVPTSLCVGLGAAVLIDGLRRGVGLWRGAYFLPTACTLVAMCAVWRWMYAADVGVIDRVLEPLLGLRDWLGDPRLALFALATVGIWHQVGLVTVIYLGALSTIPAGPRDSAWLDGAGRWQRFRHVLWPALGPTTVFVVVLLLSTALQAYDTIAAMTRVGPSERPRRSPTWCGPGASSTSTPAGRRSSRRCFWRCRWLWR